MSTLKALSIKFIAISALGLAMTVPVIAATQSTANTSTTTTEIDGVQVPTTQVMAAADTEETTTATAEQAADTVATDAAAEAKDPAAAEGAEITK